jgi:enoyl-CoA hydratase/carnithine racemase
MENLVIDRCEGFQAIFMNWTIERPGPQAAAFEAVAQALREADRDPSIACSLFFGAPRCACLETDVASLAQTSGLSTLSETVQTFFSALINAKKPLIAAIDGPAVGIGMTMLCHFDAIFATPESVFRAPFAEWGLTPEAASSLLLPEELGYRKAFEIFCLGGELTAAESERRGLITRVVERKDLHSAAFDAAARIARLPARSLTTTRELLRHQRVKLIRRARTETAIFQELLGEAATQRRLKITTRATKIKWAAQAAQTI